MTIKTLQTFPVCSVPRSSPLFVVSKFQSFYFSPRWIPYLTAGLRLPEAERSLPSNLGVDQTYSTLRYSTRFDIFKNVQIH